MDIVTHAQVFHGVECYEAWRRHEPCPHEQENADG